MSVVTRAELDALSLSQVIRLVAWSTINHPWQILGALVIVLRERRRRVTS